MDLLEFEDKRTLGREQAAAWLRELADSLARHNDIEFTREGMRYTLDVAAEVEMEVEVEVEDDECKIEIEISW